MTRRRLRLVPAVLRPCLLRSGKVAGKGAAEDVALRVFRCVEDRDSHEQDEHDRAYGGKRCVVAKSTATQVAGVHHTTSRRAVANEPASAATVA
jgi:hypothetical protein